MAEVYRFLADADLVLHFAYVAFVVWAWRRFWRALPRLAVGAELLVPRRPLPDDRRGGGRVARAASSAR